MASRAKGSDLFAHRSKFFSDISQHIYIYTFNRGNTHNSVLFEAWAECGGDWTKSKLYLSIKDSHSTKRQGKRVWLTRKQLIEKFGDAAADIIERKVGDPELKAKEVRQHPELPESQDRFSLSEKCYWQHTSL